MMSGSRQTFAAEPGSDWIAPGQPARIWSRPTRAFLQDHPPAKRTRTSPGKNKEQLLFIYFP